ncbi:hypothetical protein NPIL_109061 [Nephila pilipes]|uniref:Integrase zinc-binding domain-containing protein n=1 Tax=Nephila pilipes TaxID=299642 RepID=A0A8X6MQ72_NEPPI|nr:hypothetical protein NPIL_109061 [Nephila pilipes]
MLFRAPTWSINASINAPNVIDFKFMAEEKKIYAELQDVLTGKNITSLVLNPLPGRYQLLLCIVMYQLVAFDLSFHKDFILKYLTVYTLSHSDIRASVKLVQDSYVWPAMKTDISWARACLMSKS